MMGPTDTATRTSPARPAMARGAELERFTVQVENADQLVLDLEARVSIVLWRDAKADAGFVLDVRDHVAEAGKETALGALCEPGLVARIAAWIGLPDPALLRGPLAQLSQARRGMERTRALLALRDAVRDARKKLDLRETRRAVAVVCRTHHARRGYWCAPGFPACADRLERAAQLAAARAARGRLDPGEEAP
jgi:hypothetical protein